MLNLSKTALIETPRTVFDHISGYLVVQLIWHIKLPVTVVLGDTKHGRKSRFPGGPLILVSQDSWAFPLAFAVLGIPPVLSFKPPLPFFFAQKHKVELYCVHKYLGQLPCCLLLMLKWLSPVSGVPKGGRGCHGGVSGILAAELWLMPRRDAFLSPRCHLPLSCWV